MLRGKATTHCRSRCEPGGVKALRRTVSMPSLVFESVLAGSPGVRSTHSVRRPLQGRGLLPSLRRARSSIVVTSESSGLEIQFLLEAQRIRLRTNTQIGNLVDDQRWVLDDPPAAAWFDVARELPWTRDPFDRLLAAHARYRGWKLATGDGRLVERLGP